MQLTTIKKNDGIFIQLPKHIMDNVDKIVSDFDDTTYQLQVFVYQKETTCPQVEALSGSLKPYIGTDDEILDDDEKAFLQALLDDDNRIKAGK